MILSAINAATLLGLMISLPALSSLAFVPPSENSRMQKIAPLFHHPMNDRRAIIASTISTVPVLAGISSSSAITPEQASKSYDTYAETYDNLDGGNIASSLGIDEARKNLLSMAKGDVLEIGVGTGLNLDSYRFDDNTVRSLTLVDISEGMLSQAKLRIRQMGIADSIPVKFVRADATSDLVSLLGENKFDTAVDTFSLCVMGNEGAKRCLQEMTGVVRKGGQILLIENTRASNPILGYYQDITASTAADVGGKGCLYNQNVGEMIQQTKGLRLEKEVAFAAGLFRSFACQKI
mmetsp:Transcript_13117/g.31903  ORF Transcript_13117/g.31903 Transcript_13117/m.31903 type:complete len:293 (-) Transcript_13117:400-1278(-)